MDFAKENAFRCGCILGSGIGGIAEVGRGGTARCSNAAPGKLGPFLIAKMIANAASGNISIRFGLRGPKHHCFHCVFLGRARHRRFAQCDSATGKQT